MNPGHDVRKGKVQLSSHRGTQKGNAWGREHEPAVKSKRPGERRGNLLKGGAREEEVSELRRKGKHKVKK